MASARGRDRLWLSHHLAEIGRTCLIPLAIALLAIHLPRPLSLQERRTTQAYYMGTHHAGQLPGCKDTKDDGGGSFDRTSAGEEAVCGSHYSNPWVAAGCRL